VKLHLLDRRSPTFPCLNLICLPHVWSVPLLGARPIICHLQRLQFYISNCPILSCLWTFFIYPSSPDKAPSAPVPSSQLSGLVPTPRLPDPEDAPGQSAEAPGVAQPLPGPSHGPWRVKEAPVYFTPSPPHTRTSPVSPLQPPRFYGKRSLLCLPAHHSRPSHPTGHLHTRRNPPMDQANVPPSCPNGADGRGLKRQQPRNQPQPPSMRRVAGMVTGRTPPSCPAQLPALARAAAAVRPSRLRTSQTPSAVVPSVVTLPSSAPSPHLVTACVPGAGGGRPHETLAPPGVFLEQGRPPKNILQ